MVRRAIRPSSTDDLSVAERRFVAVLQQIGFGWLQGIRLRGGEVRWEDPPIGVRTVKFGATARQDSGLHSDFELKKQIAEFFEYIRGVDDGVIRRLEVHHGLPFSMEIQYCISRGMPDVKEAHVEAV